MDETKIEADANRHKVVWAKSWAKYEGRLREKVKEPLPKPAYNIQAGTEGQFVVGFSLHQRTGDTNCLIPHLEGVKSSQTVIASRRP